MSDAESDSTPRYPTFTPQVIPQHHQINQVELQPVRGQGVFGFVDGSILPPSAMITAASGKLEPNPDYEDDLAAWTQTDQMILSTITASLTDEVLLQVYTATTPAAIWTALHTSFASASRAKLIQLRQDLANTRKNELSATEYYFKIKNIADELHLAGSPLSADDFVTYVLAGLGPEYDSLVTMVSTHVALSGEELYSFLLTTEARIRHHCPVPLAPPSAGPAQAHFSRPSSGTGPNYGNQYGNDNNYGGNTPHGCLSHLERPTCGSSHQTFGESALCLLEDQSPCLPFTHGIAGAC